MCQCFICVGKKDQAVEMYRKGIDALQKGIAVEVNYGHGKRPLLITSFQWGFGLILFNREYIHLNLSVIKEN